MEFEVTENFYKYSPWLKIWEVIRGLLMLFYVPIAYGKHLFDKIRGIEEPNPREQNVWQNHIEFDTYALESLALSNEESMQLLESETLDFPDWKDWDDPFRFLLKFRSQPEIEALNNTFFDEIDLKTELGIYLIRVNKKGKDNNAYSLWRVNGCQQGFRSVASFGFGGQESASKPPQAICKPL
jgi:hypothetical protein